MAYKLHHNTGDIQIEFATPSACTIADAQRYVFLSGKVYMVVDRESTDDRAPRLI